MKNKQIEKALYLPKNLRDFHNQKDFFKMIQDRFNRWSKEVPNQNIKNLSWIDLHILSIDFILFQFAQEGYVLKKDDRFLSQTFCDTCGKDINKEMQYATPNGSHAKLPPIENKGK